ncbi:flagellar FlbD family protein [Ornithinibacillus bavariensis]|uniref:flagellar FlbD family protein n=1 Tax=Ornithinibacillus bavariensis TaxID=545502 RepID=UPI000EE8D59A|nr:hypothetical protein [Ornithinibacillus sp.]
MGVSGVLIEVTDHFDGFKSLLNINQITEIKQLGDRTAIFTSDGRQIHVKESYEDIVKFIKIKNFVTTTIKQ